MAEKRDREDTPDALDDEAWFRLRDAAIAELREQNLRGFLREVKRQRNQARKKQRRSTTSPRRKTGPDWMHRTRFSRSQDLYEFRPAHIVLDHFVERTLEGFSDKMCNDPATFVIRQGNLGFVAFRKPDGTMARTAFCDTCCVQGVTSGRHLLEE
ncbi:hypothetical protein NCS57_00335500 [Fusarium keratoplasticum]|uniref:Uncharacterized protein n=1 Tax=Fusarium keratoplasticum TaxID=1328300 RepID=A0ACC0RB41_9HYPO|nr:hypothetical protein NCS57_00335500 [Fusarium keratoplasticum]KAI8680539.1 hypothetical protein NCS57_00335500 [Fusarium keratoplasticum]KAI8686591.1 hypothetical protein NCS55_00336100 [Fusarium keratoplasticum]